MRVAVLISGGVDSSVALYLLKEQGFEPAAFYIKVWLEDDLGFGDCPWRADVEWVKKVTEMLGLELQIVPLQREYWNRVVEYTIAEVKNCRTPNPDMMCNRLIKFGAFYEKYGMNFDKIATGHYANVAYDDAGQVHLRVAKDPVKDQTYFLSQMSSNQVALSMFPVGSLMKKEVRNLAQRINLPNFARPDSQGICFLGKINFRDFLKRHVGEKTGKIIELTSGKVLGTHKGFWFYTIGQRTGLGLSGGPWIVVEKEPMENIIYVANGYDPEENYKSEIRLSNFNWIFQPTKFFSSAERNQGEQSSNIVNGNNNAERIFFKIRHTPVFNAGALLQLGNNEYLVKPDTKVAAVARGQFGVIYKDGECLGGGVIC